jgi:hypothetical protein
MESHKMGHHHTVAGKQNDFLEWPSMELHIIRWVTSVTMWQKWCHSCALEPGFALTITADLSTVLWVLDCHLQDWDQLQCHNGGWCDQPVTGSRSVCLLVLVEIVASQPGFQHLCHRSLHGRPGTKPSGVGVGNPLGRWACLWCWLLDGLVQIYIRHPAERHIC